MTTRIAPLRSRTWAFLLVMFAAVLANATTFKKQATIVDLVGQSELILRGTVKDVTDGIDDRGIPYTEVTIRVSEALKGQAGTEYKFRQFGLLKPRKMSNGRVNLMVTPDAWATYTKGEDTILFLHKHAAWTGLQTTTGLAQGKFKVSMGNATNHIDNAGLFEGVEVDPTLLGDAEKRVMGSRKGAVNAQSFSSIIRQAVKDKWVENGRMKNGRK